MHIRIQSPQDLGRLIHAERKRQAIRQDDLAAIVGASHVAVRDVENGKPTVQLGRVLRLLDELGIALIADLPTDPS